MRFLNKVLAAKSPEDLAIEWINENMAEIVKERFQEAAKNIVDEAYTQMPNDIINKKLNVKVIIEHFRRSGSSD